MINLLKKYWVILLIGLIIVGLVYYFGFSSKGTSAETLVIAPADFVQAVSVAGKVAPAKSVDLGFNRSGKVVSVPVEEGQAVGAGQIIAALDSRDAELDLENAKIALAKITNNSSNGNSGLDKKYEDGLASVNKVFVDLTSVVSGLDDILNNYTVSTYKITLPRNEQSKANYDRAQASFWRAKKAFDQNLIDYQKLSRPVSNEATIAIVNETYATVQLISQSAKDAYTYTDYVYNKETNPDSHPAALVTDRSNINTWISLIDVNLANLGANKDSVKNDPLDIQTQELVIKQKENAYNDCFIRAPFAGVITKLDIKSGEIATAGVANVSMINSGLFQIESYVPEINIANIKIGNPAKVTLDAYGEDVIFDASVISIDPAETIRDGVSTYKIKLQFKTADPRIKSGMTANLSLTTESKSNVISVPPGAIIEKNGQKFVQVKNGDKVTEQLITAGSVGALGQTEVVSGLKTGDTIILNPKTN